MSDEEFAGKWLEETRKLAEAHRNSIPRSDNFQTLNGEFVRSKSEKILLDALHHAGVLYVYEAPLFLADGVIYPDATALNQRTREVFYLEHLGMMDKPEYAEGAILKIRRYEASGYFLGKQLLITLESSNHPLGSKSIERMIREYLL